MAVMVTRYSLLPRSPGAYFQVKVSVVNRRVSVLCRHRAPVIAESRIPASAPLRLVGQEIGAIGHVVFAKRESSVGVDYGIDVDSSKSLCRFTVASPLFSSHLDL